MESRLKLHSELLKFLPNVYFQPPSNINMIYPCIVYNKTDRFKTFASNQIYLKKQEYSVTVIDRNPDSDTADNIEEHFENCAITQYFTTDNLNHTNLKLYY